MSATTVREDKHSLYFKSGGYLFRPVFPVGQKHRASCEKGLAYAKHLKAGDKFRVKKIVDSLAYLSVPISGEVCWYSHGCYMKDDGKHAKSEELFKPEHETWDKPKATQTTLKQLIDDVSNHLASRVITSAENEALNEGIAQIQTLLGQVDGMFASMFFDNVSFKAISAIETKEERQAEWRQLLVKYAIAEMKMI